MDSLIREIYEAAVIAEKWPGLLRTLGEYFGTKGALLFTLSADSTCWVGGGEMADIMEECLAGGWMADNERPTRVQALRHPGFVTELDVMSEQELLHLPICREFLHPRGCFAAAGTYVTGLDGAGLMLSVEGFPDHQAAMAAIPQLNTLRPHLARAIQLAGQFRLQLMRGHVEALQAIGAATCVINATGKLMTNNARFEDELGNTFLDIRGALCLSDKRAQQQLSWTTELMRRNSFSGCSIVIGCEPDATRVLHVLPISGRANDLFCQAAALLVLTNPARSVHLSGQFLQQLFDLTPAEARLAVLVGTRNATLSQVAADAGLSINTAKSQMRSIFQKTGTERQTDLVRLLMGAGTIQPAADGAPP
ncbi:helix-turn-helix transcriptional regulator [Pseudoduganella chitinolytica]|uniref:HTH luxR-type domain-containing protein n=1 Tax=Pseudoduganella chitinolytica TaxID=34070 RepID=A0ABY8BFS7_9BURK|nr:hypothetical protein [Pseudoduganella chitinolytica]WEF34238.1 hypothetical protein PX653_05565 [Pseudoduganella chitinolytica]